MNYSSTTIVGRLAAHAKFFAATDDKKAMAAFPVAVNRGTGEDSKVTYYNVEVRGKTAENINQYLKSGKEILVTGNVEARAYTDGEGKPAASLTLYADPYGVQLGAGGDKDSSDPV